MFVVPVVVFALSISRVIYNGMYPDMEIWERDSAQAMYLCTRAPRDDKIAVPSRPASRRLLSRPAVFCPVPPYFQKSRPVLSRGGTGLVPHPAELW